MIQPASPVLIFGATGTVGRATAQVLAKQGHNVIAAGRRDPGTEGVQFAKVDVQDPSALKTVFTSHRPGAVISCLASRTGAPADAWAIDHDAHQAILTAAVAAQVQHFVLLSAICVQKPRLAFQHAKLAFEATLQNAPVTWSIVRPTALFKSLSGQVERVRSGKPYLMFGDGRLTACTPISDHDLGTYLASCLTDPSRQNATLPIGGPGPALTPAEMGAALFRLTGQPPKYRRVPLALLKAIGSLLRLGGTFSPRLKAKADLAAIGHYYASESMLVWDADQHRYDPASTPSFGQDHLFDYYRALLDRTEVLDRGDHAVF